MSKVLLVEDDNSLREIFEMRLQADGYQTLTAGDGEEGLSVALREKPDLIIADVMMPKLSGFEMVENIRSVPEMKNTKVIMMTALGQAEDQARGESLGVVKYLVKSQATLEDFAGIVKDVLGASANSQSANGSSGEASKNNQERKDTMQDDNTPTSPMGGAADSGTPSDAPAAGAPPTNPITGAPADDSSQMSTAQEQDTVQSQINSFAGTTPAVAPTAPTPADAPAEPATFAPATPPADGNGTAAPYTPPADSTMPATPPADGAPVTPPAGDQPPAAGVPTDNTL